MRDQPSLFPDLKRHPKAQRRTKPLSCDMRVGPPCAVCGLSDLAVVPFGQRPTVWFHPHCWDQRHAAKP